MNLTRLSKYKTLDLRASPSSLPQLVAILTSRRFEVPSSPLAAVFPRYFPAQKHHSPQRHYSTSSQIMADRPTLVKPPPLDPSKSAIENVLELTELSAISPVRTAIPALLGSPPS
jgi:hypothetical protein